MGIRANVRLRDALRHVVASAGLVVGYLFVGVLIARALSLVGVNNSVVAACVTDSVVAAVLLIALRGERSCPPPFAAREVVMLLCASFVVWLVGVSCSTVVYDAMADFAWSDYSTTISSAGVAETVALSLLFAPIAEELMLRRVIYPYMRQVGVLFSMVVTSALFAGMHGTLVHLPFTFLLGLLLCVTYEMSGRIWVCMAAHAFVNFLSLFLAPHLTFPNWMLNPVVCAVMFGGVVFALFAWSRIICSKVVSVVD